MEKDKEKEKRLYDIAKEGNVASLHNLIQEDPLILEPYTIHTFRETPLHLAAMFGHVEFVKEILTLKPELASEPDHKSLTPLHLASAKGYLDIVKSLLLVNKKMCFARDQEGRNPLHLAATKGRLEALRELVRAEPSAARVKLDGGDTILHLCVENNKIEALEMLVQSFGDKEFVNSVDAHGNTILHLAVANKQLEMVRFLVGQENIEVNTQNSLGLKPIDILSHSRRNHNDLGIFESLQSRGEENTSYSHSNPRIRTKNIERKDMKLVAKKSDQLLFKKDWVERKKNSLMVVASLIATMGFQAGVYPPGGSWQDDENGHIAGLSILSYNNTMGYKVFLVSNTLGFTASLSVIFMLISGLPFRNKLLMWLLMMILWVAITATGFTYVVVMFLNANKDRENIFRFNTISSRISRLDANDSTTVLVFAMILWLGLMALMFLAHTVRLTYIGIKKFVRFVLDMVRRLIRVRNKYMERSDRGVTRV